MRIMEKWKPLYRDIYKDYIRFCRVSGPTLQDLGNLRQSRLQTLAATFPCNPKLGHKLRAQLSSVFLVVEPSKIIFLIYPKRGQ